MRTILANRKHERYFEKCGENLEFSFGLIIGQVKWILVKAI